jgi:hypothetical protein
VRSQHGEEEEEGQGEGQEEEVIHDKAGAIGTGSPVPFAFSPLGDRLA